MVRLNRGTIAISKLTHSYFQNNKTKKLAEELLGKRLVHEIDGVRTSGIIVETEAYLGLNDPAAHSYHGKVTARTKTFYLAGGHAYVYLIYGMYNCFNIITADEKTPEAILIRALEPEEGIDVMLKRRKLKNKNPEKNLIGLTSGPGKLCGAMGIDKSINEMSLESSRIYVEDTNIKYSSQHIVKSPRIGINYAGEAVNWPLRFYVKNNKFVSKS
jgi:DNA-3-methyladenine glycosylase